MQIYTSLEVLLHWAVAIAVCVTTNVKMHLMPFTFHCHSPILAISNNKHSPQLLGPFKSIIAAFLFVTANLINI